MSIPTSVTNGARTAFHSEVYEFILGFQWSSYCWILSFLCMVSLVVVYHFVLFLLVVLLFYCLLFNFSFFIVYFFSSIYCFWLPCWLPQTIRDEGVWDYIVSWSLCKAEHSTYFNNIKLMILPLPHSFGGILTERQ